MPPKLLAKPDRASGVLPVNAAARAASSATSNKQPTARLKLEVRRLPPGLTVSEFEETLGEEWKLGKGKVDWREYRHGKIRSLGKLPEQSRCYIHLVSEALVKEFEQRFLAVVFHDKAGTYKNTELRHLPPTLGYAPNQRVPVLGKQRTDNRQGMIDQDSEFIAFLEAETQPIPKALALDAPGTAKDDVKIEVKSTPLIDDLRERKANKAKAAANKAERKSGKTDNADASTATPAKDGKNTGKGDAAKKSQQSSKADTKTSTKQAASKSSAPTIQPASLASQQKSAATPSKKKKEKPTTTTTTPKQIATKSASTTTTPATSTTPSAASSSSPAPQRLPPAQRARRDAEGIKKMLQKDLGIKPKDGSAASGTARSRGASQANNSSTNSTQATKSESQPSSKTAAGAAPTTQASSAATTNNSSSSSNPASLAAPKAFLKHANPSQGMTEALIQQALSQYGDVTSVTIDPRKGTAIAVFKSQDVLQKAIAARKVSVANGAVEVLEYRDRSGNAGASSGKGAPRGSGRSGRGRGGGGGGAAAAAAATNSSGAGSGAGAGSGSTSTATAPSAAPSG